MRVADRLDAQPRRRLGSCVRMRRRRRARSAQSPNARGPAQELTAIDPRDDRIKLLHALVLLDGFRELAHSVAHIVDVDL